MPVAPTNLAQRQRQKAQFEDLHTAFLSLFASNPAETPQGAP
jgi:hypothetical protein